MTASYDARLKQIAIAVKDTGVGIPPEEQAKVFEDFRQLDSSPARRYGGTGLGLAICRRLANILEGSIDLHSARGERLDLHAAAAGPSEAPVTARQQPLVLVVEDYQDAREMYAAYLQFSGFDVAEAGNGVEAIEKTTRAPARHRPDGPGAAAHGRLGGDAAPQERPRTRHIPIVALTGHALAGHAEAPARRAATPS